MKKRTYHPEIVPLNGTQVQERMGFCYIRMYLLFTLFTVSRVPRAVADGRRLIVHYF